MPIKVFTQTLLVLTGCILCLGCARQKTAAVESAPSYQPPPSDAQIKIPTIGQAKLDEVQDAIKRVFKDSAVIDLDTKPSFFTGDFNGDDTQDLAVVIKPATGKLAEMNEEYPSWLLRDPTVDSDIKRPTLKIADQESLLAIIHGFGTNNWRDPQATQTFVLKNVVGTRINVIYPKDFATNTSGNKRPRPQGDLISENLHGVDGYLYFASSSYSWYDPKTFKPKVPTTAMFHGR